MKNTIIGILILIIAILLCVIWQLFLEKDRGYKKTPLYSIQKNIDKSKSYVMCKLYYDELSISEKLKCKIIDYKMKHK